MTCICSYPNCNTVFFKLMLQLLYSSESKTINTNIQSCTCCNKVSIISYFENRDFEEAIRERLFKSDGRGLDLPALNIQRGRDHGLAPYTKYKHICQQPFVGLPDHDEDSRRILMDLYHG